MGRSDYYDNGNYFYKLGEYEKALECFNKAIELDPGSYVYYTAKANLLVGLGYHKEASIVFNAKGVVASKRSNDFAIEAYDKAIGLDPDNSKAYHNKGIALKRIGKFEKTRECFNKAIKLNPKYASTYNDKGKAHYNQGEYKKAIDCFNEAIKLNPEYVDAYNNKGNTYKKQEKYDEAHKCYDKVIELDSKHALYLCNRANLHNKLGNYALAKKDFDEVQKLINSDNLGDDLSEGNINFIKKTFSEYNAIKSEIKEKIGKDISPQLDKDLQTLFMKKVRKNQEKKEFSAVDDFIKKNHVFKNSETKIAVKKLAVDDYNDIYKKSSKQDQIDMIQYMNGFKSESSQIFSNAQIVFNKLVEIKLPKNIYLEIASNILSYLPYISAYAENIKKVIGACEDFVNKTKIKEKAKNVKQFGTSGDELNNVIEFLLHRALLDKKKHKSILDSKYSIKSYKNNVENIHKELLKKAGYVETKENCIAGICKALYECFSSTKTRTQEYVKLEILKQANIFSNEENNMYVLGQKHAREFVGNFIANGYFYNMQKIEGGSSEAHLYIKNYDILACAVGFSEQIKIDSIVMEDGTIHNYEIHENFDEINLVGNGDKNADIVFESLH